MVPIWWLRGLSNWEKKKKMFAFKISVIQCEKIVEPNANRSPKYPFYNYNTSVTYKCETGYNLTGGDSERWCDATGNWTNAPPNCTSKKKIDLCAQALG